MSTGTLWVQHFNTFWWISWTQDTQYCHQDQLLQITSRITGCQQEESFPAPPLSSPPPSSSPSTMPTFCPLMLPALTNLTNSPPSLIFETPSLFLFLLPWYNEHTIDRVYAWKIILQILVSNDLLTDSFHGELSQKNLSAFVLRCQWSLWKCIFDPGDKDWWNVDGVGYRGNRKASYFAISGSPELHRLFPSPVTQTLIVNWPATTGRLPVTTIVT